MPAHAHDQMLDAGAIHELVNHVHHDQQREIQGQRAYLKHPIGEGCPAGHTLPDNFLTIRELLRQPRQRFVLILPHSQGPFRSGMAYIVPPP